MIDVLRPSDAWHTLLSVFTLVAVLEGGGVGVEEWAGAWRALLRDAGAAATEPRAEAEWRPPTEAPQREVKSPHAQLDQNRHDGIDKLGRLFRLGTVPRPDGRYE